MTIVVGTGVKPEPIFIPPGNKEGKVGQEPPPDTLIMDNLETSLETTVDKSCGNANGATVESFD